MWITRLELAKGPSVANSLLFALSHPLMHVEKLHRMPHVVFDGPTKHFLVDDGDGGWVEAEVPQFEIPENIVDKGNSVFIG